MIDGWLIIDKKKKQTSADVCRDIRKAYKQNVGHAGTLDPHATGILPIAMGKSALKSIEYLHEWKKRYIFTIKWGISTDTYDITGVVLEKSDVRNTDFLHIKNQFVGDILQSPPIFSAIKVNGIPAYKRARNNEIFILPQRLVTIHELHVVKYDKHSATFNVECSKGTYIRSLAVDIANACNMIGTVSEIRRTEYGPFNETHCDNNIYATEMVLFFDKIYLDINQANKFCNGQMIYYENLKHEKKYTIMYFEKLLGIGEMANQGYIKPVKVLIREKLL